MFSNSSELGKIITRKQVYRKPIYKRSNIRTATRQKRFYAPRRRYYKFGEVDHISDNQLMVYYDDGRMLGLGEYELGRLRLKKIFKAITKPVAKVIKPVVKIAKKIAPFSFIPVTGGASLLLSKKVRKGVSKVGKGIGSMFRKPKATAEEAITSSVIPAETSMVQAPIQHTQEMQNPSFIQSSDSGAAAELEPTQQDISIDEGQLTQAGIIGGMDTKSLIEFGVVAAIAGYAMFSSPKRRKK